MSKFNICIIGLGYVGLPLAIQLGRHFKTTGYDSYKKRIDNLKNHLDFNGEITKKDFLFSKKIKFTNNKNQIRESNIYIITVPSPINSKNEPDLKLLKKATKDVAQILKKDDIVVYESTVFPGFTNNIAVPILEKYSLLKFNKDFFCGYSPERINPGDKIHTVKNITKVISASNPKTLKKLKKIYGSFLKKNIFLAKSIEIAEAAKVIENTQRDLNISLINEFEKLFHKMNLNIYDILETAGTKWNFLKFKPGLVGGHCIGVDPYYLTYKAKQVGYNPKVILAGRKINDSMSYFYATNFLKNFKKKKLIILVLGLTFKENCRDIRNSKVFDMIDYFKKKKHTVDICDPNIDVIKNTYQKMFKKIGNLKKNFYDGIVVAVGHNFFKNLGLKNLKRLGKKKVVIYDIKNIYN